MNGARLAAAALLGVGSLFLLTACGDDDSSGDAGTAETGSDPSSGETVASGDGGGSGDGLGEGTVTVDGTDYSFTVFSCAEVGGTANLGGDGDVNVALGAVGLIVQVPSTGDTVTATDFAATIDGDTVTGSGTASSLTGSSQVPVELTATCSRF